MSTHAEKIYTNEARLEELTSEAIIFANTNGLLMFNKEGLPHHAPVTLFPRAVPREIYNRMTSAHLPLQKLYHRISHDAPFLLEHIEPIAHNDSFIKILIDTLKLTQHRPSLGALVSRSDYMIDEKPTAENDPTIIYTPLQVEFNAISTGFCALSQRVSQLHRYMISSHLKDGELDQTFHTDNLPPNHAGDGAATTVYHAHRYMQEQYPQFRSQFAALMVVQPGESNAADQRHIEYSLLHYHNTRLIRATLNEIYQNMKYFKLVKVDGDEKDAPFKLEQLEHFPLAEAQLGPDDLVIPFYNGTPISVVYYRSCYTPRDFTSDNDTHVYQSLELTSSIKCPTINMHLAATKKIQQILCQRDVVSQYLDNEQEIDLVLSLFANIYSLDDMSPETIAHIDHAIANPHLYVLKPMREGGGNNYYSEELRQFLVDTKDKPDERKVMILMERIVPNIKVRQALIRTNKCSIVESISEFGVFGGLVSVPPSPSDEPSKENSIIFNESFGCLVRTKADGVDEGGVAAGFSCIDSVLLE